MGWGGSRAIAIFLIFISLDSCASAFGNDDDFVWQPVPVNTVSMNTHNEITTQPNITNPCQNSPAKTEAAPVGPPAVSKFGELELDHYATGVAWSPNGKYIATSEDYDRIIKIWSFPSLTLLHTIDKGQAGDLTNQNLLFTRDGKYLITDSIINENLNINNALSIFNVDKGAFARNVLGYESSTQQLNQPFNLQLSLDGRFLFVEFSADFSNIYVYDTSSWVIVDKIRVSENAMKTGPGPEQITLVPYADIKKPHPTFADLIYELIVWDQASRAPIYRALMFPMIDYRINSMIYEASSCYFYFGASSPVSGNGMKIWDFQSQKMFNLQTQTLMSDSNSVSDIDISTESHTFAFITDISQFHLLYFENTSIGPVAELMNLNDIDSPFSLSFSPDGRFLATAGDSKVVIYRIGPQ